jgi:hypothetical protein
MDEIERGDWDTTNKLTLSEEFFKQEQEQE